MHGWLTSFINTHILRLIINTTLSTLNHHQVLNLYLFSSHSINPPSITSTHGQQIITNRGGGDSDDRYLAGGGLPSGRQGVLRLHQEQDGARLPGVCSAPALHGTVPLGRWFEVEVR